MLARLGVTVEYYDPSIGAGIEALMRPNTSVVFTESPASNTFEVQDIPAITRVARAHGAVTMMDNTWATPLFFRPLDHGIDVSIHAATKYPAGHSDVLLGTVSANEARWGKLHAAFLMMGICAGPDDVYQVLRGLRSMGVRLERHQKSTLEIARWLEGQPGVARCCTRLWRVIPATPCGSVTSAAPAASFPSCSTGAAQKKRRPSSTRCGCSGSAIPGAAMKALPCRCGSLIGRSRGQNPMPVR